MSGMLSFLQAASSSVSTSYPIYGDELHSKEGEAQPSRVCIMILPDSKARIPRDPRTQVGCRRELVEWTHCLHQSDQSGSAVSKRYDRFIYIYSVHLNDFISKHPEFSQVQVLVDYTVVPIRQSIGPFAGALRGRKKMMPPLLETIRSANAYPNLKTLALDHNYLSDEQGVAIAKNLTGNTTITSLDLSFNLLGDKTGHSLAELLQSNTSLVELNLGFNEFTDMTGYALSVALVNNTSLKILVLSGNTFLTSCTIANFTSTLAVNRALTGLAFDYTPAAKEGGAVAELVRRNAPVPHESVSSLHNPDRVVTPLVLSSHDQPALATCGSSMAQSTDDFDLDLYPEISGILGRDSIE